MSKCVALAWEFSGESDMCGIGYPDIRYVSDLNPHLEMAHIGYEKIWSRADFCVYMRASKSDVGKRSNVFCQCKRSLGGMHEHTWLLVYIACNYMKHVNASLFECWKVVPSFLHLIYLQITGRSPICISSRTSLILSGQLCSVISVGVMWSLSTVLSAQHEEKGKQVLHVLWDSVMCNCF